jgi:RimJ/RimL family protein N-acetyltransferase
MTSNEIENTYRWMQDPELKRLFMFNKTVTPESNGKFWRHQDPATYWTIYDAGKHVGNWGIKGKEVWVYIGESEARGKGLAYGAMKPIIMMSAGDLIARCLSTNHAARGLFLKLGFIDCGKIGDAILMVRP